MQGARTIRAPFFFMRCEVRYNRRSMEQFYKRAKKRIHRVKRYWLTAAFFGGFLTDLFLLDKVDSIIDNLILFFYVVLSMASLLVLYAGAAEKFPALWSRRAVMYAPLTLQYAFGGLLSGMLIFYGRSGSWYESWPFLFLIIGVIYGNETMKNRTQRLIFNIAMLFIGLFAYVVLIIPVLIAKMGALVFVGSGLLALFIMLGFVKALRRIVPNFIQLHLRAVVFTIGVIYVSFNFLYFANVIPPIPLSMKDVGIYHSVVRFEDSNEYQVKYEKPEWYQFWVDSNTTFHYQPGDNIYCFASVFAPTRLETEIFHRWERYDDVQGAWVDHGRFSYPIEGGRDNGFRGYTLIKNYSPGTWRCSVETARGQVIGAEKFEVAEGPVGEFVTEIR